MVGVSTYEPPQESHADVTHEDAMHAIDILIATKAHQCGYAGTQKGPMRQLAHLVDKFLMALATSCSELAELANRRQPTIHDVLQTFEFLGIDLRSLEQFAAQRPKRHSLPAPTARRGAKAAWAAPTSDFLASDSESDDASAADADREPPDAVWNVYATQQISELPMLQLVNRKLDNARLVETSLLLPRVVNYKTAWYTTVASNDSKLPSANLYTARLRGTDDMNMTKRPRRYRV
ncbi:hypothetical protein MSPP1_002046 [Malassezia sp. CBS 17886]|nr:hypothetical protein MSPP1_002046 [Malassezia sp. CBS 17886]